MKKAIIIGATSGLGKELAKLLAKNDYLVGITGRRTELLNNIEAENPKLYRIKSFDITEIDIIETNMELVVELRYLKNRVNLNGFKCVIVLIFYQ